MRNSHNYFYFVAPGARSFRIRFSWLVVMSYKVGLDLSKCLLPAFSPWFSDSRRPCVTLDFSLQTNEIS